MTSKEVRARIEEIGIMAAIRVDSAEDAVFAAEAVVGGGIPIVEITLTVPDAIKVISRLVKKIPHIVVGAGGVRRLTTARQSLDAGALFLTSDGLHPAVVEFAAQEEVVAIPGALTPTEVMHAWEARSDFVKVVPCAQIGGEIYIASLHRMFPHIPLVAAGGVNQQNASKFIFSGATALGIGRELLPPEAIRHRQEGRISNLARRFLRYVKSGREH
jgi:2-dehydro-3-deoxyphosphogluconate aldolase/(4S)-4-hydroxy-2-oxoglutarate aldolase